MKKIALFILAVAFTLNGYAQFTVETHEGQPITDGSVFEYGTIEYPTASLDFYVNNVGTEDIDVRIRVESITNTNGDDMELCFGICYNGVSPGQSYPVDDVVTIAPGENQDSEEDHFFNTALGDGTNPVEYVFTFYQVDNGGNEIGDSIEMTYRYDPALSIAQGNKINATILSTVVDGDLRIQSQESLTVNIYDVQGKLVQQNNVSVGTSTIALRDRTPQLYLVTLIDAEGNRSTHKVIKR